MEHKRTSITINLHSNFKNSLNCAGQFFLDLEKLYCMCCQSIGIGNNSLKIGTINLSKLTISVKGLGIPLTVVKAITEDPNDVIKELNIKNTEPSQFNVLFEQISMGIDNVDPEDITDHVKQAVQYWLANK